MRRPEAGIFALAVLAVSCAIPTDFPNWDTAWDLPIPQDSAWTIGVSNFLPSGVTVDNPPTRFSATITGVPSISRTLGAQCPACPSATAPKPAFTAPSVSTNINLAAGSTLNTATLAAGSKIDVAINNGFGFDPIKPPGGSPGTVSLTVNNGATTLGSITLSGATDQIPSGATTNVPIPLSGTINTASPLTITMTMDSPAGSVAQPVTMSPAQTFTATATPTINISSATVNLPAQSISTPPNDIDLTDVDQSITNRIADSATTAGAMILMVNNPFAVAANATLTFTGTKDVNGNQTAIVPVVKNVTIPASTGSPQPVSISLTGQEFRRILGSSVHVAFSGTTGTGLTTVTPTSKITVTARMQVRFYIREIK